MVASTIAMPLRGLHQCPPHSLAGAQSCKRPIPSPRHLMQRRCIAVCSSQAEGPFSILETESFTASTRRGLLLNGMASIVALNGFAASNATAADAPEILQDTPGFGSLEAKKGDLVLVHYTGKIKDGAVFDSTKGDGLMYLNGGPGTFRPAIIQIGAAPVPGISAGLMQGIEGMRVGGVRTFSVPPSLAFGGQTTVGPFAIIPGNSTVTYEVEVLRLSRDGPDALMKGVAKCGQGGAGAQETGCRDITPLE